MPPQQVRIGTVRQWLAQDDPVAAHVAVTLKVWVTGTIPAAICHQILAVGRSIAV
jgi:hypothetical protein